jgi:hypothetical protein
VPSCACSLSRSTLLALLTSIYYLAYAAAFTPTSQSFRLKSAPCPISKQRTVMRNRYMCSDYKVPACGCKALFWLHHSFHRHCSHICKLIKFLRFALCRCAVHRCLSILRTSGDTKDVATSVRGDC